MGILQAIILEWVAMPSSRGSSQPRNQTGISCMAGGLFTVWATREATHTHTYTHYTYIHIYMHKCIYTHMCVLFAQLCSTLCDSMDCSSPGSFVHGILQARLLEWVPILFFGGSSQPRDGTQVSCIAGIFFTIWATREAPINTYWVSIIS